VPSAPTSAPSRCAHLELLGVTLRQISRVSAETHLGQSRTTPRAPSNILAAQSTALAASVADMDSDWYRAFSAPPKLYDY